MHAKLFTPSIILLFMACNQQQPASTLNYAASDLATENLKGNITQVETDTYIVDSTGKTGPLDDKNIEMFDSSGYAISVVSMNGKDSIKSQTKYQHNEFGLFKGMQVTGANGEKKSAMDIEFDSSGKFKVAKSYDSTGKMDMYYSDITANKFALVTGAKGYHPDSTLKLTFTNDFDSVYYVGGITKDSVGKVTYNSKVKLDDNKNMARFTEMIVNTDPKTKKDSTTNNDYTYKYEGVDSNGNWTQKTELNKEGKPSKIIKRIITYKK